MKTGWLDFHVAREKAIVAHDPPSALILARVVIK
jgi:hypothetical protein